MAKFYVLSHYVDKKLVGVWVEQLDGPPVSYYFDPTYADYGESVVVKDKPPEISWEEHMTNVSERVPWTGNWWVNDEVEAPVNPDVGMVADLMLAEDSRLRQ